MDFSLEEVLFLIIKLKCLNDGSVCYMQADFHSKDVNWWTGVVWITVMSLSDGTHSLQRIHWWVSDVSFLQSVPMTKQTHRHLGWPEDVNFFVKYSIFCFSFRWTITLTFNMTGKSVPRTHEIKIRVSFELIHVLTCIWGLTEFTFMIWNALTVISQTI